MLGGSYLAGRALDQRAQVFAGEPTNLDATTLLGLCVELRPGGESCGRRIEEAHQAARRAVVDFDPGSAAISPP
jgi:hypothetical protein